MELGSIGPGPLAAMILADLGADVVRVARPGNTDLDDLGATHTLRGRRQVTADLKDPADRARVLSLIAATDVLIEGFRPGVTERLGLGPSDCEEVNPRLVYGRITGWGQHGPWATKAGHDINYLSVTGALHAIGPAERPVMPLNLVADFGGGTMFLVAGVLAGLVNRDRRSEVTVVDAAMVDGVSTLLQPTWEGLAQGAWVDSRESNLLDGAAPFYRIYECSDGGFMAVGSLEPQFFAMLLDGLGMSIEEWDQHDRNTWPDLETELASRFASRTRDEWSSVFDDSDACVSPVLSLTEASQHPHMLARGIHQQVPNGVAASAAPRVGEQLDAVRAARQESLDVAVSEWHAAGRAHA